MSARSCSSQGASGRTEYGLSSSSSDELDEEGADDDDEDENDREAASAVDASMPCASISKCDLPAISDKGLILFLDAGWQTGNTWDLGERERVVAREFYLKNPTPPGAAHAT